MQRNDSMPTPEMRRRVASFQYEDDHEGDGNSTIRVISSTFSPTTSASPYNAAYQKRSHRKAVPSLSEERGEEEIAVIRAGNILMEQVALQAQRRPSSTVSSTTLELLPSAPVERRPSAASRYEKTKYSDQPFYEDQREDEEYDAADTDTLAESLPHHDHLQSSKELPQLTIPAPTHGNLVPPLLPQNDTYEAPLLCSSSASSTLTGISRSLQWSQKFPQGRHLSRAKSRTTLREKESLTAKIKLTEARAGLRLLSKRREDVMEEEEAEPTRVAKWNQFKWTLFFSILLVFIYGTLGLIYSLLTWAEAWDGAETNVLVDTDIVICE